MQLSGLPQASANREQTVLGPLRAASGVERRTHTADASRTVVVLALPAMGERARAHTLESGMTHRGTTNRNARGGAPERRKRKQWLLNVYGDGKTARCSYACGRRLTFETLTVDRYPVPGCDGGTYRRGNIRPACEPCNSSFGGKTRRSS